jgi:hypothetical protein
MDPYSENNMPLVSSNLPDYLHDLWSRSSENLNVEEKGLLERLLIKYKDVFSKSPDDLGRTDRIKHHINTSNATPRRLPIGKREIEKQEVHKMLEKGIIEPSKSPWSAPIVLVTKKDGSPRFCVDYRALNSVTKRDAYPLPRVDECLEALSNAKWYNSMDLNSGFLASRGPPVGQGEDGILHTSRTLPVCCNAIWDSQQSKYF